MVAYPEIICYKFPIYRYHTLLDRLSGARRTTGLAAGMMGAVE